LAEPGLAVCPARPSGGSPVECGELGLDGYDFALPPDRIAQVPAEPRDSARLLVLNRQGGELHDQRVTDLPGWLAAGDCLVINDTRVVPARLLGRLPRNGRDVEALLLEPRPGTREGAQEWEALLRPARHCPPGTTLAFAAGAARALVTARGADGRGRLRFEDRVQVPELLAAHGLPPLPPYIRRYRRPATEDWSRYQTVYADKPGAVAAPTAGLHFTPTLLARLVARGVELCHVTLHVGPGTFRPVRVTRLAEHRMEAERYEVPVATIAAVARARREERRVVAVGTTTVRALETAASSPDAGGVRARPEGTGVSGKAGWTDLTIVPGHRFRAVDTLLTNFHLPRSSLLLLAAAFAGRRRILQAYRHAVADGYRFYSYGDAMLIL